MGKSKQEVIREMLIFEAETRWREILENYEDMSRHQQFVYFCQRQKMLDFGAQRYRQQLESNPDDEIAKKFQTQIRSISQFMLPNPATRSESSGTFSQKQLIWILISLMVVFMTYAMALIDPVRFGVFRYVSVSILAVVILVASFIIIRRTKNMY